MVYHSVSHCKPHVAYASGQVRTGVVKERILESWCQDGFLVI
jgi:hypothetical protein